MHNFGAEMALITSDEAGAHDITLILDADAALEGAPTEITGEITGAFRSFDDRAGIFLLYEEGDKFHTVGIPVDAVAGYRISDLPEYWAEEDRVYLEGDRESFLEMVEEDLSWLMKDTGSTLSDACFCECEETIPTWADLKRMETWQRACPEMHRWYEGPEIFLIAGVAATLDLDTASRADRLRGALEDLNGSPGKHDGAVALARATRLTMTALTGDASVILAPAGRRKLALRGRRRGAWLRSPQGSATDHRNGSLPPAWRHCCPSVWFRPSPHV